MNEKYHPYAVRNMALKAMHAWHSQDIGFPKFINAFALRMGLTHNGWLRLLTRLAGY